MKRIILLVIMLGLAGCASAGHRKQPQSAADSKNEYVEEMQGSRVYAAIKSQLQKGATVNVMVEYQSSYDGLPAGYLPEDFGCEADGETVIETEKIFLLESFAKSPCFSVIDRSRMNASLTESQLGLSGVTASNIQPGGISGASHLIVIEGKNHFFRMNGKNQVRYTEIKKLLDIQKDVVVAMDKLSEERDVEYVGTRRTQTRLAAAQPQQPQQQPQTQDNTSLQQLPPRVEVSPAPGPVETIKIIGSHFPPPDMNSHGSEEGQGNETVAMISQNQSGPPAQMIYVQAKKIPDWQIARIIKQRYPAMKGKDNKAVVQHFINKHPEYKNRIITTGQ